MFLLFGLYAKNQSPESHKTWLSCRPLSVGQSDQFILAKVAITSQMSDALLINFYFFQGMIFTADLAMKLVERKEVELIQRLIDWFLVSFYAEGMNSEVLKHRGWVRKLL